MVSVAAVDDVPGRLEKVRRSIARACVDTRRDPAEVNLVCVSKTFSADEILPALRSGQRIFGENRVQEAAAKWPALRVDFPDIELHLIGPLQSNKVEMAIDVFDTIRVGRSLEDRVGHRRTFKKEEQDYFLFHPGQYGRGKPEGRRFGRGIAGAAQCLPS